MKRIHDSLQRVFQRHRLVFWYDATGEWAETFKAYPDAAVAKLSVAGNEFGAKVRIVRDPNPEAKFLVYVPMARPVDADNWLLDLLLQGYEYKADKRSLRCRMSACHMIFSIWRKTTRRISPTSSGWIRCGN